MALPWGVLPVAGKMGELEEAGAVEELGDNLRPTVVGELGDKR